MKIVVISAAFCIALASAAMAETGGYPASPSHGITGTNPDGTPRYGSEPERGVNPSANTVGRSGAAEHKGPGGAQDAGTRQQGK